MSAEYADRRTKKQRDEQYREAAKRLYPLATVREHVTVNEDSAMTGAFMEVVIWIPREELP